MENHLPALGMKIVQHNETIGNGCGYDNKRLHHLGVFFVVRHFDCPLFGVMKSNSSRLFILNVGSDF